ncbi:MAG: hypothetical protein IJ064_00265 [Bacteroidaceae bacterium]|nr:hypothetical protein [Bacteroidaceae bacterium]
MKTRKQGYHHVTFPDGHREDMVVVELDEWGSYVSHHPLQGEEASVEWVGGEWCIV